MIKGVGPNTGKNLAGVHGIGPVRAAALQEAARAAVDAVVVTEAAGSVKNKAKKGKAGKTKKAKKSKDGKKKVRAEKKGKKSK